MPSPSVSTAIMTWLEALPADGWRGTIAALAGILDCRKAKLAVALKENEHAIADTGWMMTFALYHDGRRVKFSRPAARRESVVTDRPQPIDPAPGVKPKKARKAKSGATGKPSSDTGVTP